MSEQPAAPDVTGFTPPQTSSCNQRSDAFARWCRRRRLPAQQLSFTDVPGGKADHSAVLVDGWIIDWTYRQFDPTVPEPLVEPLEQYLTRWDDWGTDYLAGMILNSWKRNPFLAPP